MTDDKPMTDAQARQQAAGQYLALSAAVHALMATHPNCDALESQAPR